MTSPGQPQVEADANESWSASELAANPHANADKQEKVREMFAAIAKSYDLNNRVHSLWQDQLWRRFAVKQAQVSPGDRALDVACGTGDLTEALAKTETGEVIGLDYTAEMLDLAKVKKERRPESGKMSYIQGDAQALPFEDASFDVLTIAFGIRNVQEPKKAIAEFARVLKPGGRLVILEFGRPGFAPVRWFNDFYCGQVMPRTATLISGDTSGAYRYLPRSVGTFMDRQELEAAIEKAGFGEVSSRALSMGICLCYRGVRDAR